VTTFSNIVKKHLVISCGVLLESPEGKVFLVRPYGMRDVWQIPKGHKNENETDEETARREFFEETGIKAPVKLSYLGSTVIDRKLVKIFKGIGTGEEKFNPSIEFYMKLSNGNRVPECIKGEWFKIEYAQNVISPYQRKFLTMKCIPEDVKFY
jgi:8-oxo-dGTP pyrophosphatase MutT (NUDIX family)